MNDICTHIKFLKTCQKNEKKNLKYEKLTAKEAEAIPWDTLLVYLIGPYKIIAQGHDKPIILESLIMVDPETGWL